LLLPSVICDTDQYTAHPDIKFVAIILENDRYCFTPFAIDTHKRMA